MKKLWLLLSIAVLLQISVVSQAALAQQTGVQKPPQPTFKTCSYRRGHPTVKDEECTSAVKPHSSVECSVAIGSATSCHVTFSPSGKEWHLKTAESAGNGNDSTVQMTCDGTPTGPYGIRCVILIRPNPDVRRIEENQQRAAPRSESQ
jgi:hypothetical protein